MTEARRCPRCAGHQLADYPVEGVTVDFCSSCRGIWCDPSELEELLGGVPDPDLLPLPFGDADPGGPPCPACGDAPLTARRTAVDGAVVLDCFRCRGVWLDGGVLPRLRAALQGRRRERERMPRTVPRSARREAKPVELDRHLAYGVPEVNALALPAAFLVALLLNFTPAVALLYPVLILVHEFGHALTAWLSGRAALPLPIGFTYVGGERSVLVGMLVMATLAFLVWLGWREKHRIFAATMAVFLVIQLVLTWGTSSLTVDTWVTYGGLGAEIALSAFAIAAFYYRAPDRLRWDFWRYVVLVPFASTFLYQVVLWHRVRENPAWLPAGSAMTGTRDGSSDIDKLLQVHGWTTEEVISSYERLILVSGLLLLGHYAYFLLRSTLRRRSPGAME